MAALLPGHSHFLRPVGNRSRDRRHRQAGGQSGLRPTQYDRAGRGSDTRFRWLAFGRAADAWRPDRNSRWKTRLASAAAAWALGIPRDLIRSGLESFSGDMDKVPGRFNLLEIGGATVIVDYGHNVSALQAMVEAIEQFPHRHRTAVYTAAGDRRDCDMVRQGELLGEAFDRVILYEDHYVRGREKGEIMGLLRRGMADGDRVTEIEEIHGAVKAVEAALRNVPPGRTAAGPGRRDRRNGEFRQALPGRHGSRSRNRSDRSDRRPCHLSPRQRSDGLRCSGCRLIRPLELTAPPGGLRPGAPIARSTGSLHEGVSAQSENLRLPPACRQNRLFLSTSKSAFRCFASQRWVRKRAGAATIGECTCADSFRRRLRRNRIRCSSTNTTRPESIDEYCPGRFPPGRVCPRLCPCPGGPQTA